MFSLYISDAMLNADMATVLEERKTTASTK